MDSEKKKAVFAQYVDQYITPIEQALTGLRLRTHLRIPHAQFLFSVIDYFGLLYTVATTGNFNKYDSKNFIKFFSSDYFPKSVRCKAEFVYFIRNGLIHQIFAKASGVGGTGSKVLFYKSGADHSIPVLNLPYLEEITLEAIHRFVSDLENDAGFIENLHDKMINENYGLNDHQELAQIIDKTFGGNAENIFKDCSSI